MNNISKKIIEDTLAIVVKNKAIYQARIDRIQDAYRETNDNMFLVLQFYSIL